MRSTILLHGGLGAIEMTVKSFVDDTANNGQ